MKSFKYECCYFYIMKTDLKKIIYSMHPLERKVISNLIYANNAHELSKKSGLSEAEVRTGLEMLKGKEYVDVNETSSTQVVWISLVEVC